MKKLDVTEGTEVTWTRNGRRIFQKVTRVTPTGRFTAGSFTFNPDGTIRGGGYSAPYCCTIATDEHHATVEREKKARLDAHSILASLDKIKKSYEHAARWRQTREETEMLLDFLAEYEATVEANKQKRIVANAR